MSINQPPTAGGSSDIIEPVQNVHSRPEFVDHTLQPADTLTDADEDHRDVKRESSVTAASDSSRRPVEHATASFGHDGKKHRRSLVDILSFGLLADPWRKRPWGAKWRSSSFFITFVVSAGIATDLLTYSIIVPIIPFRLEVLGYSNIATLNSYLLVAYSAGLVLFTPICAFVFHRYPYRRAPLLGGLVVLQLALVLFTVARPYWCMVVSRVLQGIGSAVVWNVGMAMICENVPAEHVGRQLGFAMSGVSIGLCVGPVLGGVLYDRMGWHAPFIFCIIICAFEFVGRLLIVERIEVRRWGIGLDEIFHDADGLPIEDDESAQARQRAEETAEAHPEGCVSETDGPRSGKEKMPLPDGLVSNAFEKSLTHTGDSVTHSSPNTRSEPKPKPKHLTPIQVLVKMSSSPRAMCAVGLMFSFSLIIGALDPTLPVRVKDVWDKDSLFIGIIYLVASIPTFLTGPLAGAAADKWGAQVVTAPCILLALPWFPSMQLKSSFAGFIIFFMLANASLSSFLSPVGLELAQVAQTQEGIGEIHQFGAMNMAFAIGSLIGPFIGGNIYDHVANGWSILTWIWMAILVCCIPPVLCFTGDRPLGPLFFNMLRGRRGATREENAAENVVERNSGDVEPVELGSETRVNTVS